MSYAETMEQLGLDLQSAYNQAYSLDLAQKNSDAYGSSNVYSAATTTKEFHPRTNMEQTETISTDKGALAAAYNYSKRNCYFCGSNIHKRETCPAREATCNSCGKKGHYSRVCKSKATTKSMTAAIYTPSLFSITAAFPQSL